MLSIEEVYQKYIKFLPSNEKLRLIAKISGEMIEVDNEKPKRSIMKLKGFGKEIWEGIDAQKYVNELRNEWDQQ